MAKSRRRANGEGCITREPSGRYRIVISTWSNGKRVRMTRTAWKMADAAAILVEMRSKADRLLRPERMTVEGWLRVWLADTIGGERRENTAVSYKFAVEKHICPRIGAILLRDLAPVHVQSFVAEMSRDGLGGRTRENAFVVLRAALNHAVGLRLIDVNPCESVAKPRHEAEKMKPFTLEEAQWLLEETVGHRYHALLHVALTAGLRQGELLGLHWDAVDLDSGRLRVEQQAVCVGSSPELAPPKTQSSVRTIELVPSCVAALRDHRAILLAEGNGASKLVFPARNGGLESRGNLRVRFWNPLLNRLNLAHRGFHNTRHTYATLALGAGVPVTVVSANLGHSKTSTTLDVYAHVLEAHRSGATAVVERLFTTRVS